MNLYEILSHLKTNIKDRSSMCGGGKWKELVTSSLPAEKTIFKCFTKVINYLQAESKDSLTEASKGFECKQKLGLKTQKTINRDSANIVIEKNLTFYELMHPIYIPNSAILKQTKQ